jgi:hypothetical protein
VEEVNKRYDLPEEIARVWLAEGVMIPFLDGLDEVARERREACVEMINAFSREHPSLVVCCRTIDYDLLEKFAPALTFGLEIRWIILIVAVIGGMKLGGLAVIQHYALRLVLSGWGYARSRGRQIGRSEQSLLPGRPARLSPCH